MYEIDPEKESTWVNHPAPSVPSWFTNELTKIGGTQLDGTPNLKIVWGQKERKFACGASRIKYPTVYYNEKTDYLFRLYSVETDSSQECTYGEFMEAKKQYESFDLNIQLIPQYKVKRHIEWIGVPRFIIEQYKPLVMFKDSPLNWEKNRYGWWYNPETRKQEWTDINGPFPYQGRYEHFLTVKTDGGTQFGYYKAPSQGEIELIQKALQKREAYRPQSAEQETQKIIDEQENLLSKREAELTSEITDALAPHINRFYQTKVKFYNNEQNSKFSSIGSDQSRRRRKSTSKTKSRRSKRAS